MCEVHEQVLLDLLAEFILDVPLHTSEHEWLENHV
jgi:hypothetical protein